MTGGPREPGRPGSADGSRMTEASVIVSGLPRSGTSMMMRMLCAGGLPLLTDDARPADVDNPRGYYEYAPVRRLRDDASWFPKARGKALKIVSPLLKEIPAGTACHVIFMERGLDEILASQRTLLTHRAADGVISPRPPESSRPDREEKSLREVYAQHLRRVRQWLEAGEKIRVLYVGYDAVLADPESASRDVAAFLNLPLDTAAMALVVEPGLRHQQCR